MPRLSVTAERDVPKRSLSLALAREAVEAAAGSSPLLPAREAEYGSVDEWPAEAAFILSALDAGNLPSLDRRITDRTLYRTIGELRLFSDARDRSPWVLYTRDVARRGAGFIARQRLPLGYGGILQIRGAKGEDLSVDCTVRRCRPTVNGWFEGALSFNREQWQLGGENFVEVAGKSGASPGAPQPAWK